MISAVEVIRATRFAREMCHIVLSPNCPVPETRLTRDLKRAPQQISDFIVADGMTRAKIQALLAFDSMLSRTDATPDNRERGSGALMITRRHR